jgi:drug/metabolite transporter (DMT)-like permease
MIGIVLAVVATLGVAFTQILTNMLKNVPTSVLTFNMSCASGAIAIFALFFNFQTASHWPLLGYSTEIYLFFLAAGFFEGLAQNFFAYANQVGDPVTVSILLYVGIVYSFLADTFIFKIDFTSVQLWGVATMLFCNIAVIILKFKSIRKDEAAVLAGKVSS